MFKCEGISTLTANNEWTQQSGNVILISTHSTALESNVWLPYSCNNLNQFVYIIHPILSIHAEKCKRVKSGNKEHTVTETKR